MVYSQDCKKLLFCKRTKEPYKGLYNLAGGKIEKSEDGFDAAYRELKEETGIDCVVYANYSPAFNSDITICINSPVSSHIGFSGIISNAP